MPQSIGMIYVHVVFSTLDRINFLDDRPTRLRMHAYLAGTCKALGSPALKVGGVADHVHILARLAKDSSVSELVREVKKSSTKWARQQQLADFVAVFMASGLCGVFQRIESFDPTWAHTSSGRRTITGKSHLPGSLRKFAESSGSNRTPKSRPGGDHVSVTNGNLSGVWNLGHVRPCPGSGVVARIFQGLRGDA